MDNPQTSEVDGVAFFLLLQFIKEGFPKPDPDIQVATAYLYADAIVRYKHQEESKQPDTPPGNKTESEVDVNSPDAFHMTPDGRILMNDAPCPKCGCTEVKVTNVSTLDLPGRIMIYCAKCGTRKKTVIEGHLGKESSDA